MIARMTTPASKTAAGSVGTVETQFLDLPAPLALDCGRDAASDPHRLRDVRDAVAGARQRDSRLPRAERRRARGRLRDDAAAESTRDGFRADDRDAGSGRGLGWWDGMIGPGKAFDTDRFFVVSTNLLGGCRGTTGPSSTNPATGRPYGSDFPVITVADMVRAERAFLDELGIARLAAVAGGSLGGMQALEWAVLYRRSGRRDRCASRARTRCSRRASRGTRSRATRSRPIRTGRAATTTAPDARRTAGMGVARMVGHITYLSAKSLGDKFGRRLQFADDIRYTLTDPEFEVESYLRHQAETFVKRFDANTYLYTSRALTYFDLARQYGGGQLDARGPQRVGENAAHRVQLRLAVSAVGFRGTGGRASRGRQGRRAPRDRGAVRTRLLSVGGGAPDADDSGLSRT